MIKFIRISVIILLIESSTSNAKSLNHTKKISNDIEPKNNSTNLKVAESRFFPIGSPDLISSHSSLISPFDVPSFGRQLLPLINFHVKEKVKDFAKTLSSSADYIEDAIRDGWRESPLNPHNFKHILNPQNFVELSHENSLRKPGGGLYPTSSHYGREKAPKGVQTFTKDGLMHEYGIDGYEHFEKSILRELEKQEELKVEATIHTLFEQGERVEIVHGKPYEDYKVGWKPVAAPTKNYEDQNEIHSQIVSPLHTTIFGSNSLSEIESPNNIASSFHDFDNLNDNSIHSTYSVHEEEELESKLKPVVQQHAKITPIKLRAFGTRSTTTTPTPTRHISVQKSRLSSRYRKRHNNSELKVSGNDSPNVTTTSSTALDDSSTTVRAVVRPIKLKNHIQSLTTSRPSKFKPSSSSTLNAEESRIWISTEKPGKSAWDHHHVPVIPVKSFTTTTTTKSPSKFVDRARVSGYRGSIKFGQSTTKNPNK